MLWAFTHHAAARLAERHGIADPYGFLVARAPSATYLHPKGRHGLVWSFGDGVRVVSVRTQSGQTAITVLPPLDKAAPAHLSINLLPPVLTRIPSPISLKIPNPTNQANRCARTLWHGACIEEKP